MIVEYRTWTSVANVPFSDESIWLPLTRHLEREHSELGPVATWEDDASTIVLLLADDQPEPATAAENAAECKRCAACERSGRPLPDGLPGRAGCRPLCSARIAKIASEAQSASCW